MSTPRTTRLLVVLLILSAAAAAVALPAMSNAKEASLAARNDLGEVRAALSAIAPLGPSTAPAPHAIAPGDLNALLRSAASSAGIEEALTGVEPLRRSDGGGESVLLVRFEPILLRQLTAFLRSLRGEESGIHADAIELSAAPAGSASRDERWSATVTLSIPPSR